MYLLNSTEYTEKEFKEFANDLDKAENPTIDGFLDSRTDLADIGKLAITANLIPLEKEKNLRPGENDWAKYLINRLLSDMDYDNGICIRYDMVHIYTFNYDRSFEKILYDMITARFRNRIKETSRIIDNVTGLITHIHGQLGAFINGECGREYTSELPDSDNLLKIANSIKLPHELSNNPLNYFRTIIAPLGDCTKIYFLGFGYHFDILQRYMPAFEGSDKQIYGTALGLNSEERFDIYNLFIPGINTFDNKNPMLNKHGKVNLGKS